ncbi:hypothetical protein [Haloplanus pelagicus]|uniref:hypothetical protein n=1 Tax=Haloplanus pelagicus TaxID=2949995 RepID=UPI00203BB9B0|nr:hypothetical protein [Haloplanus sp. HW8-1]
MSETSEERSGALADELESSGLGPAAFASIGSVALALYYYYVKGDEQRGQFVGLWPATILAMASYLKISRMERVADAESE